MAYLSRGPTQRAGLCEQIATRASGGSCFGAARWRDGLWLASIETLDEPHFSLFTVSEHPNRSKPTDSVRIPK